MTAYCTLADLSERFGSTELAQLTDPAATSPVPQQVSDACDEAASLIDSYASTRYTTPITPVPTIVRKWACDIARKFLWKDRANATSVVTLNYIDAVNSLKDVARGLVALPEPDGSTPAESEGSVAIVAVGQVFSPTVLDRMPGGPSFGSGTGSWESLAPDGQP